MNNLIQNNKLIDKLDKQFSKLVRKRDNNICQKCGKKFSSVQCAHIISRSVKITRWYMLNAITLCYYCHIGNNDSAHGKPIEFNKFIQEKLGEKDFNKLNNISLKHITTNNEFYENIQKYLDEVEEDIENGGDGMSIKYPYE